jgi:hypothetical protein
MAEHTMVIDLTVRIVRHVVPTDRLYLVSENLERNAWRCRISPLKYMSFELAIIPKLEKTNASQICNPYYLVDEFCLGKSRVP